MCTQITCRTCGKPTWSGCGLHVEHALQGVPKADRCQGHTEAPATEPNAPQKSGGFLSRLTGGG